MIMIQCNNKFFQKRPYWKEVKAKPLKPISTTGPLGPLMPDTSLRRLRNSRHLPTSTPHYRRLPRASMSTIFAPSISVAWPGLTTSSDARGHNGSGSMGVIRAATTGDTGTQCKAPSRLTP